jgi:multidrug transporter EmrE-like cation transporter
VSYVYIALTILLTVYGQLVLKWQVGTQAALPFVFMEKWPQLLQLLARPWVLSAFVAAFGASLCWMLAISRLELSRAYPFMALNFVLVAALAVPLFGETITAQKLIGIGLVVAGLIVISQG